MTEPVLLPLTFDEQTGGPQKYLLAQDVDGVIRRRVFDAVDINKAKELESVWKAETVRIQAKI